MDDVDARDIGIEFREEAYFKVNKKQYTVLIII